MEIGEYVRLSRNQGINKIIDIDEDGFLILDDIIADEFGDECYAISPEDINKEIVKHNKNIKKILEVGDLIEYKVDISPIKIGMVKETIGFEKYLEVNGFKIDEIKLLSVLTKEQYEANCYRLEE